MSKSRLEVLEKYGLEMLKKLEEFTPFKEKIAVFSHNDLDGVFIIEIIKILFKKELVTTESCSYGNINEKIIEFLNSELFTKDMAIWIFDIGVNEEVQTLLNKLHLEGVKISLVDHHKSNSHLNNFEWAHVYESLTDLKGLEQLESGTSLGYLGLKANGFIQEENLPFWNSIVEVVREYDTWSWENREVYTLPEDLNLLFFDRKYRFSKDFLKETYTLKEKFTKFPEKYSQRISEVKEEIKAYADSRLNTIRWAEYFGHKVAFVYADRFPQQVVDLVDKTFPEADIISILDVKNKKGNLRSRKEGVFVLDLATKLGGGGHPQAAGFRMNKSIYEEVVTFGLTPTEREVYSEKLKLFAYPLSEEVEIAKEIRAQIKYRLKSSEVEQLTEGNLITVFSDSYISETGQHTLKEVEDVNSVLVVDLGLRKAVVFAKEDKYLQETISMNGFKNIQNGVEFLLTEEEFKKLIAF